MSDLITDDDAFVEAARDAELEGFKVLVAGDHDLFLDLDTEESWAHFPTQLAAFRNWFRVTKVEWWFSKNENHHVWIYLDWEHVVKEEQKLTLQLYLGSDPLKEFLTLVRLRSGMSNCIRLFRPKGALVHQFYMEPTQPATDYDLSDLPFE